MPSLSLDWEKIRPDAVSTLQSLVQFNTVNPPGAEEPVIDYLQDLLQKEGIATEILAAEPTRDNLFAHLPGSSKEPPLLLMSHVDVVGVEPEKWSVHPFSGAIDNGYLYGRGAIDDKGMAAAEAMVLLLLKRLNVKLKRDVVYLAAADEESGGKLGIAWLVDKHRDKLQVEYAINEGGRIRTDDSGQVRYVCIQNTEKVPYNLTLKVKGTPGHASVPLPDNPIFALSQALAKIVNYKAPLKLIPTTEKFFAGLAKKEKYPASYYLENANHPLVGQLCREALAKMHPVFHSMLCNSISPTVFQAGIRANVIPSEAQVNLNCRLLPGEKITHFVEEVKRVISDPRIEITYEVGKQPDSPESPVDSPVYRALETNAKKLWPEAEVVPLLSTGATDSAELRAIGVKSYGILPFPLSENDEARMHGHDERIPLDGYLEGIKYLFNTTVELAAE